MELLGESSFSEQYRRIIATANAHRRCNLPNHFGMLVRWMKVGYMAILPIRPPKSW